MGGSYRPNYDDRASDSYRPHLREPRRKETDTYRPDYHPPRNRPDRQTRLRNQDDVHRSRKEQVEKTPDSQHRISKPKSKSERRKNPSTRIHSIRKQLQMPDLPATDRREKERELAALLSDRQQAQAADAGRKNLSKYHFVRFVERQKAERTLKQLLKRQEQPAYQQDLQRKQLAKEVHICEVNVNYAKYAPLADKYISLFPAAPDQAKRQTAAKDDEINVMRSAGGGTKPPIWLEIEEAMEQGEAALEAIRDRKASTSLPTQTVALLGGKQDAQLRTAQGQAMAADSLAWVTDDGVIDPADLDSDEDMSDGGFFIH